MTFTSCPGRIVRGATRFHRSVFLESQLLRAYGTPTVAASIRNPAIALLTHAGLVVKCLSSLTTLSNKNSSYPTSEYLPPICLISEYGNLFRYSYPLTQESRPQLLAIAFAWRLTNPFHKELHTAFHHRQLSVISFQMYSLCSSTLLLNFMVIK